MKQEQIKSIQQNSFNLSKINKFLLGLSILLPLAVLFSLTINHEKQDILHFVGKNKYFLVSEVKKALSTLQNLIKINKIQLSPYSSWELSVEEQQNKKQRKIQQAFFKKINQLKEQKLKYFTFDRLLSDQVQLIGEDIEIYKIGQVESIREIEQIDRKVKQKSWFEVFDKIVFSVNLIGVNQLSPPLSEKAVELLQQKITNHFRKSSLISPYLHTYRSSHSQSPIQNIEIQVLIKSSHISEIQQNNRKKLQSIFNHQQSLISDSKQKDKSKYDDFYIEQVLEELERIRMGEECQFVRNHTECKEFQLFVLYDDIQKFNIIAEGLEQEIREVNEKQEEEIKQKIAERLNKLGYWTREDKSISLLSFHSFTQQQSSSLQPSISLTNQQMLQSLLTQLIYEHLNLSPFLLLTQDRWWFDYTPSERFDKIQQVVNQFIQLNQFYKLKSALEHIERILFNQQLIYQTIPDQIYDVLTNLLNQVHIYVSGQENSKLSVSNTLTSHIINNINSFDPFPFDYKLGALIPIAIILLYPLLGFLKLLLK